MPISFDLRSLEPSTQRFLDRIQLLYADLPHLAGAEWPDYERQLLILLGQLRQPTVDQGLVRAQVLTLLGKRQPIHSRWLGTAKRGGTIGLTLQGSGGAWLFDILRPNEPVTRYTDLRCPRRVGLSDEFQVTVRLTLRPNAESRDAQPLSVLPHEAVVVEIEAPDFELTEGNTHSIDILDDRDSGWAVFGLKPLRAGPAEVRLRFFQKGNLLGQAQCDVLVLEQPVVAQPQQQPALPLAFGLNATPPKRILCVSLHNSHLHFSLYADGARVEIALPPIPFDHRSAVYTRRLYTQLSAQAETASGSGVEAQAAVAEVAQIGNLLWTDLIPPNLKRLWLDERADWAANPLLLVSDEPYIPWELVWPNEPGIDAPWGSHGPMSRWLGVDALHPARVGPSAQLTVSPWASLFPSDSALSHLPAEAALLRRLLPAGGERTLPTAHRQAVLDLLAAGECGWLHAGTHGLLDSGGEAEGASLLLEGDERLEPEVLVRTAVRAGLQKSRLGVFWNICHGGASGWSLTGVGGWAGRLIDGGASLFLAPQWTVTDKAALVFAERFYDHLTGGGEDSEDGQRGVAEAVQQARLATRELTGDPSWLAYALYAHPNARVAK